MSNAIRCPECGSTNVECVERPHHDHLCHDCGHTLLAHAPTPDGCLLPGGSVLTCPIHEPAS